MYYDAHNHLQDARLISSAADIIETVRRSSIGKMVVNGSCEEDWPDVLALAKQFPEIIPSFGYHPWYIKERTKDWQSTLLKFLDAVPAAIGEIGLDRWIPDYDFPAQEEVFVWQLRLGAERNCPVSIHCLQAWGKLLEILEHETRPQCGFVLHSYGGSVEMIEPLAKLGGYFSLPGYFAHERKGKQRETFRHVPLERLLIETDAPDQMLPEERNIFPLKDDKNEKAINHPANLVSVYEFASEALNIPAEKLVKQVETNFARIFRSFL